MLTPTRKKAGRRRLRHAGTAAGIQSGQQHAGLHLGTGDRQDIVDALQRRATPDLEWCGTGFGGDDRCTHTTQRVDHTSHGPPGQRRVTGQGRIKCLACQQAGHQAHGCTGITQIQCRRRAGQATHADTTYCYPACRRPIDRQHVDVGVEGREGRQAVLTLEETTDLGHALRQRTQHDGAMRN